MTTRARNERRFGQWLDVPGGGRRYWRDVPGAAGGWARYVKLVDAGEETLSIRQEIFNSAGVLIAEHDKFPVDHGHRTVESKTAGSNE